jgi:hypothetical protein
MLIRIRSGAGARRRPGSALHDGTHAGSDRIDGVLEPLSCSDRNSLTGAGSTAADRLGERAGLLTEAVRSELVR